MITTVPDKLYFKIGEVAKIIGVEPYGLRYWETEFPEITPVKSKSRQRLYKRQDVELIQQIRDLLYQQKFTIKGAKSRIKEIKREIRSKGKDSQYNLGLDSGPRLDAHLSDEINAIVKEMSHYLKNT